MFPCFQTETEKIPEGRGLDSFDRVVDSAAVHHQRGERTRRAEPVQRHLAIVEPRRFRRDCLTWRSDCRTNAGASPMSRRPPNSSTVTVFAVIFHGRPTLRQISLTDLDLLLVAALGTPILVAADCEDRKRAMAMISAGARGFCGPISAWGCGWRRSTGSLRCRQSAASLAQPAARCRGSNSYCNVLARRHNLGSSVVSPK
jgi:hypothetical protein